MLLTSYLAQYNYYYGATKSVIQHVTGCILQLLSYIATNSSLERLTLN